MTDISKDDRRDFRKPDQLIGFWVAYSGAVFLEFVPD